ncbi:MAG: helix-turn-helix domain-containing protein [Acidobacteriota bacterium]|nr:helix-turn-helix domain-containing protein [Acidobacteriota bacterium]
MNTVPFPSKLLTIAEVAEVLRIPKPRVYELVRTGVIPGVRILRQVRVHPDSLSEFLSRGGKPLSGSVKQIG